MLLQNKQYRNSGVAAVEMAIVTVAFVVPLIIAIWEIGRYIQVKQIVANGAREGARLAAQGTTILSNGTIVQINVNTGTPNVQQTVYDYLVWCWSIAIKFERCNHYFRVHLAYIRWYISDSTLFGAKG